MRNVNRNWGTAREEVDGKERGEGVRGGRERGGGEGRKIGEGERGGREGRE